MVTVTNSTAALFLFIYYNKFCCYSTDNTSDYSTAEKIPATFEMTTCRIPWDPPGSYNL